MGSDPSGSERLRGLHVETRGEGRALVLAHGFAGSARNWRPQVRALSEAFRVTTFDARGHARSEAPADPAAYREEAHVADLAAVVDASGDPRPVVGGLSMGAAVSLRWALDHPDRARALVLASYPADPASGRGISADADAFADALEAEGVDVAGAKFAWGPNSGLDERGAALVRQGFLEHSAQGLAHTLREFLGRRAALEDMADDLRSLSMPVLLVAGRSDRGSLPVCRRLAELLPVAELLEVPEAGHVVNLAQPKVVSDALRAFLSGLA